MPTASSLHRVSPARRSGADFELQGHSLALWPTSARWLMFWALQSARDETASPGLPLPRRTDVPAPKLAPVGSAKNASNGATAPDEKRAPHGTASSQSAHAAVGAGTAAETATVDPVAAELGVEATTTARPAGHLDVPSVDHTASQRPLFVRARIAPSRRGIGDSTNAIADSNPGSRGCCGCWRPFAGPATAEQQDAAGFPLRSTTWAVTFNVVFSLLYYNAANVFVAVETVHHSDLDFTAAINLGALLCVSGLMCMCGCAMYRLVARGSYTWLFRRAMAEATRADYERYTRLLGILGWVFVANAVGTVVINPVVYQTYLTHEVWSAHFWVFSLIVGPPSIVAEAALVAFVPCVGVNMLFTMLCRHRLNWLMSERPSKRTALRVYFEIENVLSALGKEVAPFTYVLTIIGLCDVAGATLWTLTFGTHIIPVMYVVICSACVCASLLTLATITAQADAFSDEFFLIFDQLPDSEEAEAHGEAPLAAAAAAACGVEIRVNGNVFSHARAADEGADGGDGGSGAAAWTRPGAGAVAPHGRAGGASNAGSPSVGATSEFAGFLVYAQRRRLGIYVLGGRVSKVVLLRVASVCMAGVTLVARGVLLHVRQSESSAGAT